MRIINLIENTQGCRKCFFEHGLSFYIETENHKMVMDAGATNAFLANAKKLKIDLGQVDTLILSHGHYDHSGGILSFVDLNKKADIYIQKSATDAYYHKEAGEERYIGIDDKMKGLKQVKWLEGNCDIDKGIFLFSGVTGRKLWPSGNRALKVKRGTEFYQDDFAHEQYLVIEEEEKKVLISGCAHNGILNILEKFEALYGVCPDAVISGFHMMKKNGYTEDDLNLAQETAVKLKEYPAKFYTGHCTGKEPYQIMKAIMGNQLVYVHSGDEIIF